ncbi:MAG: inorganic pyrophosphatase [Longimicrobiales bacterium]
MTSEFSQWRPHPWHGLSSGPKPPHLIHAFVEITPFDLVKYEVDKGSGYLRVDRAQKTSSLPPALYGFIPRTYAGRGVAGLMDGAAEGDGDPLDVCVLSERLISRAEVIVTARVVGGIPMVDGGQADDKIVAILKDDPVFGHIRDLDGVPSVLVDRLVHYFGTYKMRFGEDVDVTLGAPYGREHAERVVTASITDYRDEFDPGAVPPGS